MKFKEKYKKDNELIKLNPMKLEEISKNIKSTPAKFTDRINIRKSLIAVATIMFCVTTYYGIDKVTNANDESKVVENGAEIKSKDEATNKNHTIENNTNSVDGAQTDTDLLLGASNSEAKFYIEEGKIRANINACYSNGFMIYKGRIYDANSSYNISLEDGKALMGEKLGVTWNYDGNDQRVTESNGYLDIKNTKDFWSIIAGEEVYTFKDYNDDFRLIVYSKNEYGEHISIYENLSNMPLNKGYDIFRRMNMKGNIKEAKWQSFEDWNYGIDEYKALNPNIDFNNFIEALYNAEPEPLENEEFRSQFFYKESENPYDRKVETKFLYLKLKDGIEVRFRLFSNGYVYYEALRGFIFKVNDKDFSRFWSEISYN